MKKKLLRSQGLLSAKDLVANIRYPIYGLVIIGNRLPQTRLLGGVETGEKNTPATRLCNEPAL